MFLIKIYNILVYLYIYFTFLIIIGYLFIIRLQFLAFNYIYYKIIFTRSSRKASELSARKILYSARRENRILILNS